MSLAICKRPDRLHANNDVRLSHDFKLLLCIVEGPLNKDPLME